MYEVRRETLENALKPFDLVRVKNGDIAFIREVNVNGCQITPEHQISYSLKFLCDDAKTAKVAWYTNDELELLGNLLIRIAEVAASNSRHVETLFNNMQSDRGNSWN